jgi:type II secretory pathway pseudopilin PulG
MRALQRNRPAKILILAGVIVVFAILAVTAYGGSRNWSVNFASKVTCQNYSATMTGTHHVYAHINNNGSQWNTFDIQLVRVRDNWPDVFYTRYTKNCNVDTNSYWNSMPTGTFHWDMYKPSGGPNYTGSGTNYWPG